MKHHDSKHLQRFRAGYGQPDASVARRRKESQGWTIRSAPPIGYANGTTTLTKLTDQIQQVIASFELTR
jgi:hypothetical protein